MLIETVGGEKDIKIANGKIRSYERKIMGLQNAINFLEKMILELNKKFSRCK
jgi:hypothetical protein